MFQETSNYKKEKKHDEVLKKDSLNEEIKGKLSDKDLKKNLEHFDETIGLIDDILSKTEPTKETKENKENTLEKQKQYQPYHQNEIKHESIPKANTTEFVKKTEETPKNPSDYKETHNNTKNESYDSNDINQSKTTPVIQSKKQKKNSFFSKISLPRIRFRTPKKKQTAHKKTMNQFKKQDTLSNPATEQTKQQHIFETQNKTKKEKETKTTRTHHNRFITKNKKIKVDQIGQNEKNTQQHPKHQPLFHRNDDQRKNKENIPIPKHIEESKEANNKVNPKKPHQIIPSNKSIDYSNDEQIQNDIKKVLLITDELLGKLPEEVIEEFASSEDFELYQKVMYKYHIK